LFANDYGRQAKLNREKNSSKHCRQHQAVVDFNLVAQTRTQRQLVI